MFREREKVIEREKEQEQERERESVREKENKREGGTLVLLGFVPKIPKVITPCHLQGWDGIAKNPCK